ncbi:MAG: hypothetical protein ACLP9Y_07260 [Mycobacterium sp.]
MEVRVAHPLYGEVRRGRAAPTRLRRLRGLVAAELAAADDRDDIQVVVRRATLSLDSDLTPDADLLVRAAHGASGWRICPSPIDLQKRQSAPERDRNRTLSVRMHFPGWVAARRPTRCSLRFTPAS